MLVACRNPETLEVLKDFNSGIFILIFYKIYKKMEVEKKLGQVPNFYGLNREFVVNGDRAPLFCHTPSLYQHSSNTPMDLKP